MASSKMLQTAMKAGVVLAVALMALSGCSQSPTGVPEESPVKLLTRAPSAVSGVYFSPMSEYRVEQAISAEEGGTLVLCDVTLTIPAGAVSEDTLFSIYIPDINVFYNQFGADGLVFDVPVTVTMSYREADLSGVDESTIRLAWYNEATGEFEDINCGIDYVNKTVTAQLNHFSAYGLISDDK